MDSGAIKKKIQRMTNGEQEKRFDELNKKLRITAPHPASDRDPTPPTADLEEAFERALLKKSLGY
jgi:hypothetical protein